MVNTFDRDTKLSFRNGEHAHFIKFGGLRDNDASKGIRSGQLKLAGYAHLSNCYFSNRLDTDLCRSDVARFFAPSLQCILEAILEMRENAKKPISVIFCAFGYDGMANISLCSPCFSLEASLEATTCMTKLLGLFDTLGSMSLDQEGLCTSGYLLLMVRAKPHSQE